MNANPTHNAITLRIEQLRAHYLEFSEHPEAKICLWLLETDEVALLDEFFNMECSVYGKTPDFFIRFESPFNVAANYGKELVAELAGKVKGYREELGEAAQPIDWLPLTDASWKPEDVFPQNLNTFSKSLDPFEGKVVAYIRPQAVSDFTGFEHWLLESARQGIPSRVSFMLIDDADDPSFTKLTRELPRQVFPIQPKLDMAQAMKEIASAAGKPDNPGTQFQHRFIDMSKAVGAGNMGSAQQYANQALEIAIAQGWTHLQVAIYLALGSGWMSQKENSKALQAFEKAQQFAEGASKQGDPTGPTLVVNALFSKGAALLADKSYRPAQQTYQETVRAAEAAEDAFKIMEAWRMTAYCHEWLKEWDLADQCYRKALNIAGQLDETVRANSTVSYIGNALMQINDREYGGDTRRIRDVEEKMVAWMGPQWRQSFLKNAN